jgi:hypothetical protein
VGKPAPVGPIHLVNADGEEGRCVAGGTKRCQPGHDMPRADVPVSTARSRRGPKSPRLNSASAGTGVR